MGKLKPDSKPKLAMNFFFISFSSYACKLVSFSVNTVVGPVPTKKKTTYEMGGGDEPEGNVVLLWPVNRVLGIMDLGPQYHLYLQQ